MEGTLNGRRGEQMLEISDVLIQFFHAGRRISKILAPSSYCLIKIPRIIPFSMTTLLRGHPNVAYLRLDTEPEYFHIVLFGFREEIEEPA